MNWANKFNAAINASKDSNGNLTESSHKQVKDTFLIILKREILKTYKLASTVSLIDTIMLF